jgi:hypothetical protein
MAKTKRSLRVQMTRTAGRGRKKPTSRVERMFEEVRALVSDTGDRSLARSDQGKNATRSAATKKASRTRGARTS